MADLFEKEERFHVLGNDVASVKTYIGLHTK